MGACATKPKVLKADSGDAPAPAPAPELSQEKTVPETKLENGSSDAQGTEIVDEDKVDSKPRCLSHLFNDQEKTAAADPSGKEEIPPETEKKMNPPPEEKPSETIPPETEKKINPPTEKKPSETNPPEPEPPVSDSVTENAEPIESNTKVEVSDENEPPPEKTESPEKPTETEEPVIKVISN
ncbi:early nodulin-75-like [Cucurbita pepo subsp. pepo]|uniref:early nodulin-75-like n=1 Tax=Cucurbita pepo subsp. pepo TaxID=3664 RepID=UPI000C9DA4BD|nr:early nodulin-75-like [Cucurbita pepo subsp. pepo]